MTRAFSRYPDLTSRTRYLPAGRPDISIGVCPAYFPLMNTLAPEGSVETTRFAVTRRPTESGKAATVATVATEAQAARNRVLMAKLDSILLPL